MPNKDPARLQAVLKRLEMQRAVGVQATAFMDDLVNNPDRFEKYRDSLAGNVVALQITAVESVLMMWFARHWDESHEFSTIPSAFTLMTDPSYAKGEPDQVQKLKDMYRAVSQSEVKSVVRVIRSEKLAHLIEPSRDRMKLFPQGFDKHNTKTFDLLDECKRSIGLIDMMSRIENGISRSYESSAGAFSHSLHAYWDGLPIFSELE